jgi:hypothetical protein
MIPVIARCIGSLFWSRGLLNISASGVDPRKDLPKDAGHPKTHTAGMLEISGLSPKFLPAMSRALGRFDAHRWA